MRIARPERWPVILWLSLRVDRRIANLAMTSWVSHNVDGVFDNFYCHSMCFWVSSISDNRNVLEDLYLLHDKQSFYRDLTRVDLSSYKVLTINDFGQMFDHVGVSIFLQLLRFIPILRMLRGLNWWVWHIVFYFSLFWWDLRSTITQAIYSLF